MRTPARAYMVRLRAGVPVALAEQRITTAAKAVGSDFRPGWTGVHLESVHTRYVAELRPLLLGIGAAAGLLLILVCTNVAILVLLRALGRQKEVAVRVALGAERRHLLRMLIAEAGLVCAAALALGLVLTMAALRTLEPVIEARLGKPPTSGPSTMAVDSTVVLMIGGVGLLIAISMAFIPLVSSRRRELAVTLRRGGHGATDGMAMRRLRSTLIALEVAGAFMLLAGGGLMIRSVLNLVRVDLGFDAEHVARIGVVLPASYREPLTLSQFYEALAERLGGASPSSPVSSAFPPFYELNKRPLESDASNGGDLSIGVLPVGGGYFAVHAIAVRQGREFTPADRLESQPVAIVSESLARELWPNSSAIGRRLRTTDESIEAPMGPWRTVVGVVGDVRRTYGDDELRDAYLPFLQAPTRFANLHVRTDRPSAVPLARLETIVSELDPRVRVAEPKLLATEDQQFARARFMTALLGACAAFATVLALLGIYGVTAYTVLQRKREIAIRVAVGASYRAVVRMFLREGAIVLVVGVVLGVWGTSAAGRILESQIHGVKPFDVVTLLAACVVLVACGLLATWLPARRAASHDLLTVLKQE